MPNREGSAPATGVDAIEGGAAPFGPVQGQVHRLGGVGAIGRIFQTLIEHHHHVRPQGELHLHAQLGSELVIGAVEVRLKPHPLAPNAVQLGETPHLEPAGIGQQQPIPGHEAVQSPHLADEPMPGPQVEMVGVAEDDLGAQLPQIGLAKGLHRSLRPHRHERGGVNTAAGVGEYAGARGGIGVVSGRRELQGHGVQTISMASP